MKRIFLIILVVGVLSLGACVTDPITHYVNEELGFSIDYPRDWFMEELSSSTIGIKPTDSAYNEIQIFAEVGTSLTSEMTDLLRAEMYSSNLQQIFSAEDYTDFSMTTNQRTTGQWDWVATFSVTYEDTPLQGGELIKETESMSYTIFYLQSGDWLEGEEVMDSFSPIQ